MSQADVTLRNATPEDVPLVLRFIRELAEYERMLPEVVATEDGLRDALFGSRRGGEVVLAFRGTEPVGFAVFFHNFSTFLGRSGLYLEDLYVRPEERGAGVGRRLLAHLAHLAVERGCRRLEWAVLDWNSPAIGFYTRLGARAMDEWTVFRLSGDALDHLAGEAG